MSDRVIIVDVKRNGSKIPITELKQMVGRAGRRHDVHEAYVDIVLKSVEYNNFVNEIENDADMPVESALHDNADELAFHIVSEISNGLIRTKDDISKWHEKTLAYLQGKRLDVDRVIKRLKLVEAIIEKGNEVQATPIGYISTKMYFTTLNIFEWKCNFDYLFENELENEVFAIAWAISNTSYGSHRADPRELYYLVDEYKNQVSSFRADCEGTVFGGLIWWYLLGGPSIKHLKGEAITVKNDFNRILQALKMIDVECAHWNKSEFWNNLELMVEHRISPPLVPLCQLNGIGKSFALELYNLGVNNVDDMKTHLSEIESLGNYKLLIQVKKLIHDK